MAEAVPNRIVYPSGRAFTTYCVPMLPLAPARFSTSTGWPSRSDRNGASSRA